jgi:mannosyl-3-phosphoglycerate phosphatase
MKKLVIFTDLDGTVLDASTYSFEKARRAIELIRKKGIPLILCSSKTKTEIEYYRKKLGNTHPFISENGGGIFIPEGYFKMRVQSSEFKVIETDHYQVIGVGTSYNDLRKALQELRAEGYDVKGFGDMTPEEIAFKTNLEISEAQMSKERDFDEPFFYYGPDSKIPELLVAIESKGFHYTRGAFLHILGDSDKGKAVSILTELYKKEFGEVTTAALGDSPNDIPMLERVDYPVIVKKPDGTYDYTTIPNIIKADGIGPEGWNKAVLKILSETGTP